VIGIAGPARSERVTAIGDAVNYASRIEAANKDQGTSFLISEDMDSMVKNEIVTGKSANRLRYGARAARTFFMRSLG
jgi:class 3 adenylate cyclase